MKRKLTVKMGKETGLREEKFFLFFFWVGLWFYVLSGFSEKKIKIDFFFLNNADV